MRIKLISLLLSVVMILSLFAAVPVSTNAAEADMTGSGELITKGDYKYYVLGNGTALIDEYTGSASNVVIPSKIDGYTVTELGRDAFTDNDNLYSVTIPDTVTDIYSGYIGWAHESKSYTYIPLPTEFDGADYQEEVIVTVTYQFRVEGCFAGCNNLRTVNFGRGLKEIGALAFADCDSLVNITIPETVTYIGGGAFSYCDSLQNVEILGPATLDTSFGLPGFHEEWGYTYRYVEIPCEIDYGEGVFENCKKLKNVSFNDNCVSEYSRFIGSFSFYGCKNLISVNIPDYYSSIERYAFSGCSSLTSVTIPDSVKKIGYCAFSGCSSLTSVTIPESVTDIDKHVFSNCTGLTSVTVNCSKINDFMFEGCKALKDVTIGDNVGWVGEKAFHGCINLKSVTIPKSVKYIGDRAFGFYYNITGAYNRSAPYYYFFTIYGYKNTVAELYAKEYDFFFGALDTSDTDSKPGDADGDGQITVKDVTICQYALSRFPNHVNKQTLMYADVDKNGVIDAIDTTWILRYLAEMDIPYEIG